MSSFGSQMRKRFEQLRKAGENVPKIMAEVAEGATIAAVETAVNIALREDTWTTLAEISDIPEDFFDGILYIVWDEAHLPVLKAVGKLVDENLYDVRCVNHHTFLVTETLDRIIWFDGLGQIKLYSIAS